MKDELGWGGGGALYPVPTVCCPGGQDKPGGILPQGKGSLGTRYRTRNYYLYKLFLVAWVETGNPSCYTK